MVQVILLIYLVQAKGA